ASAAFAAIERTPAGAMARSIARQILDRGFLALPADARPRGVDLLAVQSDVARWGLAAGVYPGTDSTFSAVVVFNGLGREGSRQRIERIVARLGRGGRFVDEARLGERTVSCLRTGVMPGAGAVAWWSEGNDL